MTNFTVLSVTTIVVLTLLFFKDFVQGYLVFIYEHLFVFLVFNIIEFALMGLDKFLALQQYYRISEICLLFFGCLGPFGGWTGIVIFHHKISSRKLWFQFLMVIGTALHFYFVKKSPDFPTDKGQEI